MSQTDHSLHGLLAEFETQEEILQAARKVRKEGYQHLDAYTPLPVHGLAEAINFKDKSIQWTMFLCGLLGGVSGFILQWWINVSAFPLNIGGKPLFSWPAFIPVTFECTILFAGLGGIVGLLAFNGLPRLHHPIFSGSRIELATQDRFFLCVEATDPKFETETTRQFLESLNPYAVEEIKNSE